MKITVQRAVSTHVRCAQMRSALLRNLPALPVAKGAHADTMTLACYGPSLVDTWQEIEGDFFSVSGAHDFLIAKGRVPAVHVESDPRPHKADMLTPREDVIYAVASCCHPAMFEKLHGFQVYLWHNAGSDEEDAVLRAFAPGAHIIVGGSTVGIEALALGSSLGFRSFDVHGMDCSFASDVEQHAGAHPNQEKLLQRVKIAQAPGREWITSPQMLAQLQDFMFLRKNTPSFTYRFRGDGLLAATIAAAAPIKEAA